MLALALALTLSQSPTMGGVPVSVIGRSAPADYTTSLYLVDPAGAALCADANITTDQAAAITVTRATTTTCEVTAGDIRSISANKPSIESDGLNVWPSSANRVDYSEELSIRWTPTNATTGTVTGTSPMDTEVVPLVTSSAGGYYQSNVFTITGTSAVLSIFVLSESGAQSVNAVLRDTTAGADRCTISATAPTTWAAMRSRPSCNSASITSGNNHVVRVYPGGTAGSSSGDVYFWGAQVEPGITSKTPYIPTAGTAATRNADNITTTVAAANAAGCFSTTFYATVAAFPTTIASNPATLANFNNTTSMLANDGTNTATSNSVSSMSGRSESVRLIWSGASMQLGLGGSMGTAATFDGTMSGGLTTLYIGSLSGSSRFLGGWIKRLKFGTDGTGCAL
jgi:hypothetical protein